VQAVRGYGYEVALDLQIFEADYDQIERQVMDQFVGALNLRRNTSSSFLRSKLIKRFYDPPFAPRRFRGGGSGARRPAGGRAKR